MPPRTDYVKHDKVSEAQDQSYHPKTAGDWTTQPATVADALDILKAGGGGGGISRAYSDVTDGTTTAQSVGTDTLKIRTSDAALLAVAVANDDPTHGDNVLLTPSAQLTRAVSAFGGADRVLVAGGADRTIVDRAVTIDGSADVRAINSLRLNTASGTRSIFDSANNEILDLTTVGSAVNECVIENAITNLPPTLRVAGSDSSINLQFLVKGLGWIDCNIPTVLHLPRGITGNRPVSSDNGMIRYNTSTNKFEGYQAGAWVDLAAGTIDHGSLGGLGDDDHIQYPLLAGRSTGQTIIGGTASGDDLKLQSTSHATKGDVEVIDAFKIDKQAYYDEEVANTSSGGAVTINWTNGNKQKLTLSENITSITFTAPSGPCNLVLRIIQDSTVRTVTGWPAAAKWPSNAIPVITAVASKVDVLTFYFDGTSYYGAYLQNY